MEIDMHNDIMSEGKAMIGVNEGEAVPKLIDYYKKGLFPLDRLVKFYNFDQINEALADSKAVALHGSQF
ncbi:hypothetical protein [Terribacillus saccharophilus]|uniref:hypothetical protein n=1 Tax=Terribacillus saccharophilus TaxID=361277 RepID=UPI001C3E2755|nr:hypothetical protein [Terribacillus saccharophilus]